MRSADADAGGDADGAADADADADGDANGALFVGFLANGPLFAGIFLATVLYLLEFFGNGPLLARADADAGARANADADAGANADAGAWSQSQRGCRSLEAHRLSGFLSCKSKPYKRKKGLK